jgi:hypothetical protein
MIIWLNETHQIGVLFMKIISKHLTRTCSTTPQAVNFVDSAVKLFQWMREKPS